MKLVKLSIIALAMGLFVTSCGNNENKDTTTTDSTATVAPAPAPAPAPADTMHKADTAKMAPATDTVKKVEVKKEEKKTK